MFIVNALVLPQMLSIVSRDEWGANPAKNIQKFEGPAPFVIIHHSYEPAACYTSEECIEGMKWMQDFHQINRGWDDIGYTYAIGGDGKIYEGRGFNTVGTHAPNYNSRSVGIVLIGDWRTELPPENMLMATKQLIEYGIANGHITEDYTLLGHRQVRDTECPGGRLFEEIKTWPHFSPTPNRDNQPA